MKIFVNIYDKNSDVVSEEVKCFQEAIDWYENQLKEIPEEDVEETTCLVDIVDDLNMAVTITIQELMESIEEVD